MLRDYILISRSRQFFYRALQIHVWQCFSTFSHQTMKFQTRNMIMEFNFHFPSWNKISIIGGFSQRPSLKRFIHSWEFKLHSDASTLNRREIRYVIASARQLECAPAGLRIRMLPFFCMLLILKTGKKE